MRVKNRLVRCPVGAILLLSRGTRDSGFLDDMPKNKPNIVFITIDSLRADHLGSFGYSRPTSPYLDEWVRGAVNFRKHFSNSSQSPPGFFSIFSSLYPLDRKDWSTTDGPYQFLPELFQRGGYRTVGFGSAPYISSYFGYDRGYDDFFYTGFEEEIDPLKKFAMKAFSANVFAGAKHFIKGTKIGKLLNRVRYFFMPQHAYAGADEINRSIESFFAGGKRSSEPLFLWIHYMDAHNPFLSSREDLRSVGSGLSQWRVRSLNRKHLKLTIFDPFEDVLHMTEKELAELEECYDAKIRYLDTRLKNLFSTLARFGIDDSNSAIAITSDHGEAFGEHHGIGHTERLYDELLHVPFFLKAPGISPKDVQALTNHIDILPTLAELGGIPYNSKATRGLDLMEVYRGANGHHRVFSQVAPNVGGLLSSIDFKRSVFAVRTSERKLIIDYARKREEYYDTARDPLELRNLKNKDEHAFLEMRDVLQKHIADMHVL